MDFIEFNAYKHSRQNASSKAKTDVSDLLNRQGYTLMYEPSKNRFLRIVQQIWNILRIPSDSILFVQYPSHSQIIYHLLSTRKEIKKIALLHDVESLRGLSSIDKEIAVLNGFDVIISHNSSMTEWLKSNGLIKPVYDIQIFDYLLDGEIKANNIFDKFSISFAGNLEKSKFLTKLDNLKNLQFNVYGATFEGIDSIRKQNNVSYEGSFSPEDLIANIKGGWGLVWDGESIDSCTGINGEYLKYNNPHKVSMCIVSERPVIIWKQAAMAKYIESKGLGICVDSLSDIYNKINGISDTEYKKMLDRVRVEKQHLLKGANLIHSLQLCETKLGINRNK